MTYFNTLKSSRFATHPGKARPCKMPLRYIFITLGATLFSDYQALMRIWTHPWSLKLESERLRNYNFDDSDNDSLKDFVVSDEESDEEESDDEEMLVLNDTETPSSSDSSCDSDGKCPY